MTSLLASVEEAVTLLNYKESLGHIWREVLLAASPNIFTAGQTHALETFSAVHFKLTYHQFS